ncbi:MAG: DNA-binding LytR/AlgR family response regulator [Arenicella sp.]|jgi:DNA-binding LytR/AlgR family response regulator
MSKRILIVEDEPMIGEDIKLVVENLGYEVVDIVDNATSAIQVLSDQKVDLVFLDVQLNGEIDGIRLGEKINYLFQVPFLYLTSYFDDNTVFRIRKTNPVGYIVKPFKDSDIKVNLGLAFSNLKEKESEVVTPPINELFVRKNGELKRILPEDICWIKGEDNYSIVQVADGSSYTISQTLKVLHQKLEHAGFVRIQKSYVVRLASISSISGNTVYIDDEHFPIGKAYRKAFFDLITVL